MDVVCKLLILFMTVLIALLIGWIIGKIWSIFFLA
jgi:MFS superfamily sulfate permease-like transporter